MDYNDVGSVAYWYLFSQQDVVDQYKGHMVAIVNGAHVYSAPIEKDPDIALREVQMQVNLNHPDRINLSIFPAPDTRIDLTGVPGLEDYLVAVKKHKIPEKIRLEGLVN